MIIYRTKFYCSIYRTKFYIYIAKIEEPLEHNLGEHQEEGGKYVLSKLSKRW